MHSLDKFKCPQLPSTFTLNLTFKHQTHPELLGYLKNVVRVQTLFVRRKDGRIQILSVHISEFHTKTHTIHNIHNAETSESIWDRVRWDRHGGHYEISPFRHQIQLRCRVNVRTVIFSCPTLCVRRWNVYGCVRICVKIHVYQYPVWRLILCWE